MSAQTQNVHFDATSKDSYERLRAPIRRTHPLLYRRSSSLISPHTQDYIILTHMGTRSIRYLPPNIFPGWGQMKLWSIPVDLSGPGRSRPVHLGRLGLMATAASSPASRCAGLLRPSRALALCARKSFFVSPYSITIPCRRPLTCHGPSEFQERPRNRGLHRGRLHIVSQSLHVTPERADRAAGPSRTRSTRATRRSHTASHRVTPRRRTLFPHS